MGRFEIFIAVFTVVILVVNFFTRSLPPYWVQQRDKKNHIKYGKMTHENEGPKRKDTSAPYNYDNAYSLDNPFRD